MPKVTLPDGSSRDYSQAISIFDVASDIGPGLAKAALAGKVDGEKIMVTMDYRTDRVNVEIRESVIIEFDSIW